MTSPIVSHAQNFEDVRLWRAFADIENGRYIDIGAQDAVHDSVSLAFYERGWRGIHVEATPTYAQGLRVARPDEVVVQAAVSMQTGPIAFFEIAGTGLSTGINGIASRHNDSGWHHNEIWVPTIALAAVFEMAGEGPIHWLKIDVEGMEADVLQSWGDHPARPAALVIEATAPNSKVPTHQEWYDLVLSRGYRDVLFDGLSRYFVHETYAERGEALALSPNVFDGFNITLSHFASREIAAERQRAVDDAVRQGAAEREAAVGEARRALEEQLAVAGQQLAVTGQQLADERAAHGAQQDRMLALVREAGQLEGQLAVQTEHCATLVREAEAARGELLARLAAAAEERSAAQRQVADLRVRIEALSGQHALELARAQSAQEAALTRIATGQAEIDRLGAVLAEHEAAWEAEKARLEDAAELTGQQIDALRAAQKDNEAAWEAERARLQDLTDQKKHQIDALCDARDHDAAAWEAESLRLQDAAGQAGQQIAALQADLDETLAAAARSERLLCLAGQLLTEPADALDGWPRKLATLLARVAGRKADEAAHNHTAQVVAWRAEMAAVTQIKPDRIESPLAQTAAVAELGFGYKELQMLSDESPITTVPRLLAPHDAEFIDTAYQAVLGRAPDPEGRAYYLARVRTGTHKLEILRQLRRSAEGRAFVPGVAGLDRAIKRYRQLRIPLLGRLMRLHMGAEGDTSIPKQLRILANEVGCVRREQLALLTELRQVSARLAESQTQVPYAHCKFANEHSSDLSELIAKESGGISEQRDAFVDFNQELPITVEEIIARFS